MLTSAAPGVAPPGSRFAQAPALQVAPFSQKTQLLKKLCNAVLCEKYVYCNALKQLLQLVKKYVNA